MAKIELINNARTITTIVIGCLSENDTILM